MDWGVKLSISNRVEVKNEWSFTHLPSYAVCAINDTHNLALFPVFYCTGTFIFSSFKHQHPVQYSVSNYLGGIVGFVLVEHAAYRSIYKHSRIPIRCNKIQPVVRRTLITHVVPSVACER